MARDTTPARRPHLALTRILAVGAALLATLSAIGVYRIAGNAIDAAIIGDFYTAALPPTTGTPGTLVRAQALPGTPIGTQAWRVVYESTDLFGAPIQVSGLVIAPVGPAPAEGRTVVSWGHPTTGTAPQCGPSLGVDPFLSVEGLDMLLARGYVVTYTDYLGFGVPGPNHYLVGATAGDTVLDAVRAARAIPQTHAGTDVVLWGHSQGGQAVLFAAQQAATYAPELTVRAVAVAAPAADLGALLAADIDDVSGVTIGSYAIPAFAQVYGASVPGAELDTVLTPAALAQVDEMNSLCLFAGNARLHEIAEPLIGNFLLVDPSTAEPWSDLLDENSAGAVAFDAPLFVAQGLKDTLVDPQDTADFVVHERALGIDVDYHPVGWATHGTIAYASIPALSRWLDEVLAG